VRSTPTGEPDEVKRFANDDKQMKRFRGRGMGVPPAESGYWRVGQ